MARADPFDGSKTPPPSLKVNKLAREDVKPPVPMTYGSPPKSKANEVKESGANDQATVMLAIPPPMQPGAPVQEQSPEKVQEMPPSKNTDASARPKSRSRQLLGKFFGRTLMCMDGAPGDSEAPQEAPHEATVKETTQGSDIPATGA
jgi:hypothetical protein